MGCSYPQRNLYNEPGTFFILSLLYFVVCNIICQIGWHEPDQTRGIQQLSKTTMSNVQDDGGMVEPLQVTTISSELQPKDDQSTHDTPEVLVTGKFWFSTFLLLVQNIMILRMTRRVLIIERDTKGFIWVGIIIMMIPSLLLIMAAGAIKRKLERVTANTVSVRQPASDIGWKSALPICSCMFLLIPWIQILWTGVWSLLGY